MVKGALQTVKDTDIHENLVQVDIVDMLNSIAEQYNLHSELVVIEATNIMPIVSKPLALKRSLSKLIGNGVKYGERVTVTLVDESKKLRIDICDEGPGIPEANLEDVFKPYFRLAKDGEGHGLGLGISRSIINSLGGQLFMVNRAEGGLQVQIHLQRASLK
jgi:signal transduction histidine kinase